MTIRGGKRIAYTAGWQFQLEVPYSIATPIIRDIGTGNNFVKLSPAGLLTIQAGYAWDGPSGPIPASPDFMRGSLVHDALYQLMQTGLLDTQYRGVADDLLYLICIEDGMDKNYAKWVYTAVHTFGGRRADPVFIHPVLWAPIVEKAVSSRSTPAVSGPGENT